MSMKTDQSVNGFIATDPQLTHGPSGIPRFYARVGIEHFRREEDGTFTQLDPTFHNLVAYRKTAEHAMEKFERGDRFLAAGYVREYAFERDGQHVEGEEFIATKIGHDAARSTYTVDRTPRQEAAARDAAGVTREQGFDPPERPAYEQRPAAIGQ